MGGAVARSGGGLGPLAVLPTGIGTIAGILVAIPRVMLWGTVSLVASGLEHYTYDASAAVPMQAKPPKRELAALLKLPRRPSAKALLPSAFVRDPPGTGDRNVVEAFADAVGALDDSVPTGTYVDMC